MTLQQKREARAKAIADARALYAKAQTEKREMDAAETESFDKFMKEANTLKGEISAEEARAGRLAGLEEHERELTESRGRITAAGTTTPVPGREDRAAEHLVIECRGQKMSFTKDSPVYRRNQEAYKEATRHYLRGGELRALQSDVDTAGGYLVMPEMFVTDFIKNVDDAVFVRSLARKFTVVGAQTLGVSKRTAKLTSFAWGSELTAPTADSALKFGKRTLTPHYMTGSILISNDLLRNAVMNPETLVNSELARDAGELEEQAFMTGNGAQRPLGLFTASTDGISTGRDVATGSATAILADGLISAKYTLKTQYRMKAKWLFHRDGISQIAKLKDTTNQYIFQVSLRDGEPDRLLGLPIMESEWVPNTFTTGLYVGMLGDFNWYWIADSLEMQIQRLVELNARTNQTEFIARRKTDGAPMLEEAFVRIKTS